MKFIAKKADNDITVGFFLSKNSVSKRLITKLKGVENGITKNGVHCRTIDLVKEGDVVEISISDHKKLEPNASLCVPIIYENEGFVVFDKPPFMPVHPSIQHQGDTLGNFFSARYPDLTFRPINRLDRDTSGLCVVAKNPFFATALQFSVEKTYYAIVEGEISQAGTINLPIAREKESIITRVVSPDGQPAVTHYKPVKTDRKSTLLEISLETGRTHQIRVHFSHVGHPLVGDDLYGKKSELISHQALHCGKLKISLPDGETLTLKAPLPNDMKNLLL